MDSRRIKGKVGVGDVAPDFKLPSQSGEEVRLGDFVGRKRAIVLFFYPKDDTRVVPRKPVPSGTAMSSLRSPKPR